MYLRANQKQSIYFRMADDSEIGSCLKLGIKLHIEEEVFTIKALPRRWRFRLRPTLPILSGLV